MFPIALALHGGCGTLPKEDLPPEEWAEAKRHIADALRAGWTILAQSGTAVDAVEATVVVLEDSPHFNAGHGAAFNQGGHHELDASLMEGTTGRAGAVAGVRRTRHPVRAAQALAVESDPLLLIGEAADMWAEHHGLEMVENSWFSTPSRREALERMLERGRQGTGAAAPERDKHGTVGAAALDRYGHLAAATSTGGYTAKPVGRIGDTPIIGAGTWADDRTCALSGTGKGELFIRLALGHEVHARMLYGKETLQDATNALIHGELRRLGGGAGLCAVDRQGNVALPFNTEGMYRGWISAQGMNVAVHED